MTSGELVLERMVRDTSTLPVVQDIVAPGLGADSGVFIIRVCPEGGLAGAKAHFVDARSPDPTSRSLGLEDAETSLYFQVIYVPAGDGYGIALMAEVLRKAADAGVHIASMDIITPAVVDMVFRLQIAGIIHDAAFHLEPLAAERKFGSLRDYFNRNDLASPGESFWFMTRERERLKHGTPLEQVGSVSCVVTF